MDDQEVSYEPMDIDLSSHSASAMEISFMDKSTEFSPVTIKQEKVEITEKCFNIKPLTIHNLIENHSNKGSRNGKHTFLIQILKLVLCIAVGFISLMTYQIMYFKCNEDIDINKLSKTYASKIYGQTTAIEEFLDALESEAPTKIVALYGGTGVGKTYTTSLMLQDLLNYGNIYHYTMPGLSPTSEIMLGLVYCESSIIVVDDLGVNDVLTVKTHLEELVNKSKKYSKDILIILVYNCDIMTEQIFQKCNENFLYDLKSSLINVNAEKYFIKFEPLTEEHLRKCIQNELANKILNEHDIVRIMKNFNVTVDGCKGVYQKMKYLSIL